MREYVAATAGVLLPLGDDLPDGVLALWRDKGVPLDGDGLRVVQLSRHELAVAFRGAQLRETLERERQELTAIVDGATDAIIQVDEECSIVRVQSAPEAAPHSLGALEDDYFRARAADIRDVGKRVATILQGRARPAPHAAAGEPVVVAADDLDASLVAELRPELVAGVALAGGAPTGHAAIVARALGIPLALGLGEALLGIPEGEEVIVDGTLGRVLIAPDASERVAMASNGRTNIAPGGELPPLALPVVIEGNAGSAREVEQAAAAGAHSIGLLRTELLFVGRTVAPGLDEQRALYRRIPPCHTARPFSAHWTWVETSRPAIVPRWPKPIRRWGCAAYVSACGIQNCWRCNFERCSKQPPSFRCT